MNTQAIGLRATRAALFTALCLTLSSGAHALLSSLPLPLPLLALIGAVVFLLAFALAGARERGFWPIAALLVPLELAADTVFTSGQHACYGPAGGPVAGSLRSMGWDLICSGESFGAPLTHVAPPGAASASLTPWLLLAAHVSVGLVAAAWLWRGEVALARLLRAVAAATFRPLLVACAVRAAGGEATRPRPRPVPRAPVLRTRLLTHSVGLRGPPCPVH
ncbi:hypothetical protein ACFCV8_20990 [Streptomyces sp. NPDC056347]|uniref:hypothetical protein n=1 Tax=Streptomyces sp. NPDC056347 TaxID=3345790 RepID=UPI0035DDDE64